MRIEKRPVRTLSRSVHGQPRAPSEAKVASKRVLFAISAVGHLKCRFCGMLGRHCQCQSKLEALEEQKQDDAQVHAAHCECNKLA